MSGRTSVPSRDVERLVRTLRTLTVLLFAMLGMAVVAGTASAQEANSLQSITPEAGASLPQSPTEIVMVFSQELAADDVVTVNLACSFEPQEIGETEIDADRIIATTPVVAVLPKGACIIAWSLKNVDGDTLIAETTNFVVTAEPTATETTAPDEVAAAGTTDPSPATTTPAVVDETERVAQGSTGFALWLGRMLSTLGILVVFGGLALISVGWPEGPEYVVTVRFLRTAWIVSLLGTLLYLVAYSADVSGTSLGAAMSPGQWLDLLDAGWEGRGALLRIVFIVLTGWVAMRPERIIDPQSAMWAWALPGFALVAVAMSRISGPVAPIGFIVSVAHVLSVAVWFGGAALVARVVLAGPGEDDLVQATRTFSRISIPAILVAAVTGIIQVIRLDGGDLFGSSHGRVLLLKVVAVAAMLAVALAARQQVTMRLDRAHELSVRDADRFRRAFGAEAALGVVALAFSGWLLGLTPAKADPFPGEDYTREITFNDPDSGLQAVVKIGPARVGQNGFRIEVSAPEDGISNLELAFVPPNGSDLPPIVGQVPLTTRGTAQLDIADGLLFRVGGTWTLQLTASTATGVLDGATSTFSVTDADGAEVTIPPATPNDSTEVELIDPTNTSAPFAVTTTTVPPASSTSAPTG